MTTSSTMTIISTAVLLLLPSIAWAFSPPSSSSSSLLTVKNTQQQQFHLFRRPTNNNRFIFQSKSSINLMPEIFSNVIDCSNYISSSSSTTVIIDSPTSSIILPSLSSSSSNLLAFSDQGQNLAGIFFQASLLPYILFLYFLSRPNNRTPNLGYYGWQYLLLFVLGTIPAGIITKTVYGTSLANVDWLHGSAEALLTVTNVLIVLGFREAMTNPNYGIVDSSSSSNEEDDGRQSSLSKYGNIPKISSGVAVLLFATLCTIGTTILHYDIHTPFLLGIGDLSPNDIVQNNDIPI